MDDIFEEDVKKRKQLYEQFATCPVVELCGVVSSSGVGAGRLGKEELWSLSMSFVAWRVGDGPMSRERLHVWRQVTDEELRELQDEIDAETVIRIRGRVAEENAFGHPQGLLEEFIGLDSSDTELREFCDELKKPVTHKDERFGTLAFDRALSWYTAEVVWQGEVTTLNLSADDETELESALNAAHQLWDAAPSWSNRVLDYAVQELLPLKNESWLEEGEAELSPDEFKSRMTLESITVYPDGAFDFFHHDGDLFWGHAIQICGSLSEGLTDADIPG